MENCFSGKFLSKEEINNLEPFENDTCIDFLRILIDELDNQMHIGITKKVIDEGYNSLSDQQKMVFKSYIIQPNIRSCERCDEFIWEEADYIRENGLCTYCQKIWDND